MDQKLRVLAYIARGDTASQVVAHVLEDFEIVITEDAIYKIKRDNAETIAKMQERLADSVAADLDQLVRRSRTGIARKLMKAENDASEIEVLDQQYRDGEITKEEYQRKKAGRLDLSITELSNLSQKLVAQQRLVSAPVQPEGPNALPDGNPQPISVPQGTQTPAQLEAMLKAIQAGNTVELQRIVFTPPGAK